MVSFSFKHTCNRCVQVYWRGFFHLAKGRTRLYQAQILPMLCWGNRPDMELVPLLRVLQSAVIQCSTEIPLFQQSQNHSGWKGPPGSSSPASSQALDAHKSYQKVPHLPEFWISTRDGDSTFPWDSLPMFNNSSSEDILPDIQPEPLLAQPEPCFSVALVEAVL